MSAPETNVKKQEKEHKTPLAGMKLVVGFALVLLVILIVILSFMGNEPADDEPIGGSAETQAVE